MINIFNYYYDTRCSILTRHLTRKVLRNYTSFNVTTVQIYHVLNESHIIMVFIMTVSATHVRIGHSQGRGAPCVLIHCLETTGIIDLLGR